MRSLFTVRLISVGVEFCGEGSDSLQESMRQQSLKYFKNYHRYSMSGSHDKVLYMYVYKQPHIYGSVFVRVSRLLQLFRDQ